MRKGSSNYSCQHGIATENKVLVWLRNSKAKKAANRASNQQTSKTSGGETASEPISADKRPLLKGKWLRSVFYHTIYPTQSMFLQLFFPITPRDCQTSPSDKFKPKQHKDSHEGDGRQLYVLLCPLSAVPGARSREQALRGPAHTAHSGTALPLREATTRPVSSLPSGPSR